jgi:hypothetical protein
LGSRIAFAAAIGVLEPEDAFRAAKQTGHKDMAFKELSDLHSPSEAFSIANRTLGTRKTFNLASKILGEEKAFSAAYYAGHGKDAFKRLVKDMHSQKAAIRTAWNSLIPDRIPSEALHEAKVNAGIITLKIAIDVLGEKKAIKAAFEAGCEESTLIEIIRRIEEKNRK